MLAVEGENASMSCFFLPPTTGLARSVLVISVRKPRNETQAYMGDFDQKNLCKNPTLKGTNPVTNADTRLSAGCRSLDVL